jgi:hypothetical protein
MATKNIKEKYNVTGSVLVFRAGILNNLVGLSPTFFTKYLSSPIGRGACFRNTMLGVRVPSEVP